MTEGKVSRWRLIRTPKDDLWLGLVLLMTSATVVWMAHERYSLSDSGFWAGGTAGVLFVQALSSLTRYALARGPKVGGNSE
jgi:hypothetical protein